MTDLPFSEIQPHSEIPKENLADLLALARSTPPGNFAEVGVYQGGSAWVINQALKPGFKFHLYDTFKGIPYQDPGDSIPAGLFSGTSVDLVQGKLPDAVIHPGVFPGTFDPELTNFSFVHIDCDVYRACRDAIELFWPRLNPGGIIAFDDYPFEGIKKAIAEFREAKIIFTPKTIIPYFIKGGI